MSVEVRRLVMLLLLLLLLVLLVPLKVECGIKLARRGDPAGERWLRRRIVVAARGEGRGMCDCEGVLVADADILFGAAVVTVSDSVGTSTQSPPELTCLRFAERETPRSSKLEDVLVSHCWLPSSVEKKPGTLGAPQLNCLDGAVFTMF